MGTTMILVAIVALIVTELVVSRIERSRSPVAQEQRQDSGELPTGTNPVVKEEPVKDYADLTPAELGQEIKARLGPRAW